MNARDEAYRQLAEADLPGWRLVAPKAGPLDGRDIDLAHAIARAVTKNYLLLRHLISHYAARPLGKIDHAAQAVLAIGVAQLRNFDRIPGYAVVDEAAEQAKRLKLGKAVGFINAVLRQAIREPNAPLPDRKSAADYAEIVLSHPPELFRRMVRLFGEVDALRLAERHNAEAPLIVRGEPPAIANIQIVPHQTAGFFVVRGAGEAILSAWAKGGIAQAQDPTSAAVIDQLQLATLPGDGAMILDRCCGVGTKTLQLARLSAAATVVAIDPAERRIHALKRSIRSAALDNVRSIVAGEIGVLDEAIKFDRILVDVPCSNSGVLIRRPEARYRQDDRTLQSLERLQRRILADTLPRLAPGGRLVYSTCSIWEEENERQMQWAIGSEPIGSGHRAALRLVDQRLTLPSLHPDPATHHDGGYVAVIECAHA